ncbi:predicted protein [Naegleria gruberi]|uniref:Predicted protein n=1 Tax=Naegleria gruberi TaxID=5762 RepID=D2UXP5_NAEGR|nr:uncharacterized protein NAEGRDRAFT_61198 [Naegleria gruberi]EFC50322.1 predicted protein [Naegleria gruberi]|eukprot:XP_002683066.1 predicted protein [Naegleria gruberi strain NEG-M]
MVLTSFTDQVSTGVEAYYLDPKLKISSIQIELYKCLGLTYSQMSQFPSACEIYNKAIDFVEYILNVIESKKELDENLKQLKSCEREESQCSEKVNKRLIAYYLIRVFQGLKQDYCYVNWNIDYIGKKDYIINSYLSKLQKEFSVEMGTEEEKQFLEQRTDPDLILLYIKYLLLLGLYKISLGNLSDLKLILKSIQDCTQALQNAMKTPHLFTYEWLELNPIISMVWLIASYFYRTCGQLSKSEGYNTKGISMVEKYLKELDNIGFMLDKKKNDNALYSIFIKFNLLQDMILIHLSRSEFVLAAKNTFKLIEFLYQFPDLFETYRHNIHLLIGLLLFFTNNPKTYSAANDHFEFVVKHSTSRNLVTWANIYQIFWKLNCVGEEYSTNQLFSDLDILNKSLDKNGLKQAENFKSYISFIKGILCLRNSAFVEAKNHFQKCIDLMEKLSLGQKGVLRQCILGILKCSWKNHDSSKQKTLEGVSKVVQEATNDQDLLNQMQCLAFLLELSNNSCGSEMDTTTDFDIDNIRLSQPEPIQNQFFQVEQTLKENVNILLNSEINSQYEILKSWFPNGNEGYGKKL